MKSSRLFHISTRSGFGLLIAGACWLASTSSVLAQIDPLDANNERTSDPFSERGGNSNDAFFDMMHRVQLGNIRSVSEFGQDQRETIGTEAEDFRARQRAVLEQQTQPSADGLTPSAVPNASPETMNQ
jgi:hypothetical protein